MSYRLPKTASHHPATGLVCSCPDRLTRTPCEARQLYTCAKLEKDPYKSFRMHMAYHNDASLRSDSRILRTCVTCNEKLVEETLPMNHALDLLRISRIIDRTSYHLNCWDPKMSTDNEKMIAGTLFSELGMWWRPNIPCVRACLNTLWREKLTGISMVIFANLLETLDARALEEYAAALMQEKQKREEERQKFEEQRRAAEEARQIALVAEEPQGIVIPPIKIPRRCEYQNIEETYGNPMHVIRHEFDRPAPYSWANARG
jgi:hypothetical protein